MSNMILELAISETTKADRAVGFMQWSDLMYQLFYGRLHEWTRVVDPRMTCAGGHGAGAWYCVLDSLRCADSNKLAECAERATAWSRAEWMCIVDAAGVHWSPHTPKECQWVITEDWQTTDAARRALTVRLAERVLSKHSVGSECKNSECPMCMDPLARRDRCHGQCGHVVCRGCASTWIESHMEQFVPIGTPAGHFPSTELPVCPNCRGKFF